MLLLIGTLEYEEGWKADDGADGNFVADPDGGWDMLLTVSDGREGCWRENGASEELVTDAVALSTDPVGRVRSIT